MCGIAGAAWAAHAPTLLESDLRRMISVLEHRGPDDEGMYQRATDQGGIALGFRRLSIIDLAGGHQPLSNEDGTIWIVFNGEIYNYRELRTQLESQGHRFRTASDTEVIVHLYEQYGTDCVSHLRGMFALAIWDANTQQLYLARDRLGQKPLIYREESGRLLFASELKALLQVSGAARTLKASALDQFLTYQYVPHPHTILDGYQKLPPAHWALYSNGRLQIERYWSPYQDLSPIRNPANGSLSASAADRRTWSPEKWRNELRSALTESVRLRMRSDVPLGAFLSGGIDSTIIAGLMQQLSSEPVHTFSIGFPVRQFDERSFARQAAAHLKTRHHEAVVEPAALDILPRLIWQYDEPFADSSAIPSMYLSEMTRQHVTVALSGDGGDELFAGYDRYRAVKIGEWFDRLPRPLRAMLTSGLWQHLPASVRQKSRRRRLKRLLAALGDNPEQRYLKWINIFDNERRQALYTPEFYEQLGTAQAADFLLNAYRECPERDFVTRTACADLLTYLPGDILNKVDHASMAASLECRSPFLDHHVVELAAQMPIELKLSARRGKRILSETFTDLLPPAIQRRPKMGFGVPLDGWFRGELRELLHDLLLDHRSQQRGYFQTAAVRRLVEEHISRQWDHSYRLWALLCFEAWHRMFLDPPTPPSGYPASL